MPAIFFGDNQTEESSLQKIRPHPFGQVFFHIDIPIVNHAAEFFDGAFYERSLLFGELRIGFAVQAVEIGLTREKFPFYPYVTRFDNGLLGWGNSR